MRRLRVLAPLLLLLLPVLVTGCSDDEPGAEEPEGTFDSSGHHGESEQPSKPAGNPSEICRLVTDIDVQKLLGAMVTVKKVPGGGSCSFVQDDPRNVSLSIALLPEAATSGGIAGAKPGLEVMSDATVEEAEGIGDAAFVVIGPNPGEKQVQGHGLVEAGGAVFQVSVLQASMMTEDHVRNVLLESLVVVADKV